MLLYFNYLYFNEHVIINFNVKNHKLFYDFIINFINFKLNMDYHIVHHDNYLYFIIYYVYYYYYYYYFIKYY